MTTRSKPISYFFILLFFLLGLFIPRITAVGLTNVGLVYYLHALSATSAVTSKTSDPSGVMSITTRPVQWPGPDPSSPVKEVYWSKDRPFVPIEQVQQYPHYAEIEPASAQQSLVWLRRAAEVAPNSRVVRWGIARVALASGNTATASRISAPLIDQEVSNPFLYHDMLTAFSLNGQPDRVIALYESGPMPIHITTVKDVVALAYIQRGAQEDLERAFTLHSGDLYAAYHLWIQAKAVGNLRDEAFYRNALIHFPLEALDPTDERLLAYTAGVIPNLLDESLWNKEKILDVISFLVWRKSLGAVEQLLWELRKHYPNDPDWPFYQAELYRRLGDWDRAETTYREAKGIDPAYAPAYLGLGDVTEMRCTEESTTCDKLTEAAQWYKWYFELEPNDLLGLKKLVDIYEKLEATGTTSENPSLQLRTLREELKEKLATQEPEYRVDENVGKNWILVGYDLDEEILKIWSETIIWLYWMPLQNTVDIEQAGWYRAGKRWVEVRTVKNLAPNGGFQWNAEIGEMYPYGWPAEIYGTPISVHEVVLKERNGRETKVARLSNNEAYLSTSFVSIEIPIDPNAIYLQAGWIKGEGGNGYLGRYWIGNITQRPYNYIAVEVKEEAWTHYSGVTWPLEGARGTQLWLLNYETEGSVYFDDIFFVELETPPQ